MRALLMSIPLLVPLSADAGLILELTERGTDASQSTASIYFAALLPASTRAELEATYTQAQVGSVLEATPEQLTVFDSLLKHPEGRFMMHVGTGGGPSTDGVDELWRTDWQPNYRTFTAHAPRRGFGLTGYHITDVTQTFDYILPNGERAQTVRIFGDPISIPEPASCLLMVHILVAVWCHRRHYLIVRFVNQRD